MAEKELLKKEIADSESVSERERVTFTPEQMEKINQNYIPKKEYERIVDEYKKLVNGFNTLLKEYNEMHIKALLTEQVDSED